MVNYVVGIDPGTKLSYSVWEDGELKITRQLAPMKKKLPFKFNIVNDTELFLDMCKFKSQDHITVLIEHQWGRPISGSKQSFITGFNYGRLVMSVEETPCDKTIHYITPNEWMKHFWGKQKNTKKKLSLEYAQKLHGDKIKDHNVADAILIGKYGVDKFSKKKGKENGKG